MNAKGLEISCKEEHHTLGQSVGNDGLKSVPTWPQEARDGL